jgi:hypothetical protein
MEQAGRSTRVSSAAATPSTGSTAIVPPAVLCAPTLCLPLGGANWRPTGFAPRPAHQRGAASTSSLAIATLWRDGNRSTAQSQPAETATNRPTHQ